MVIWGMVYYCYTNIASFLPLYLERVVQEDPDMNDLQIQRWILSSSELNTDEGPFLQDQHEQRGELRLSRDLTALGGIATFTSNVYVIIHYSMLFVVDTPEYHQH